MKNTKIYTLVASCFIFFTLSGRELSNPAYLTVSPIRDSTTVLHNPAMGFVTIGSPTDTPNSYFSTNNKYTVPYSNIVYMRSSWVKWEPTEGNYIWNTVAFKALVQSLRDHHFRLALRVIAQDSACTPSYVINAVKAGGYSNPYSISQPYRADVTNPIWKTKFSKFIQEFGKAFNDPTLVDFIDANGLGIWGEGNNVGIPTRAEEESYFDWHLGIYGQAFTKVLMNTTFSTFGVNPLSTDERIAFTKNGTLMRLDGMGSCYPSDGQLAFIANHYPATPLFSEKCYSFSDSIKGWRVDSKVVAKAAPSVPKLQTYMNLILDQAMSYHVNTLDFSNPDVWVDKNPTLAARFVANIGYRLRPSKVGYLGQLTTTDSMRITHVWTNDGVGVLPNGNRRWNNKYAIAFALFNPASSIPTKVFIDAKTDPGVLVKGTNTTFTSSVLWNVPAGNYQLAVGIIDQTRPNDSLLNLAMKTTRKNGWYIVGNTTINNTNTALKEFDSQVEELKLSPNPANSQLKIKGITSAYDMQISDMQGNILVPAKSYDSEQILDVSSLPNGVYIVSVKRKNGQKSDTKFVISR